MDAQVELLLPLEGVHWRVLDGIEPGQFEQAKPALASPSLMCKGMVGFHSLR